MCIQHLSEVRTDIVLVQIEVNDVVLLQLLHLQTSLLFGRHVAIAPFASIPVPAPSMPSLPSLLAFLLEEHAAIAITGRAIISPFSTLFSCISMIPLLFN